MTRTSSANTTRPGAALSTDDGWTFVIVHAEDLFEQPAALLDRLVSELRGHGIRIPGVLADDWRRHFRVASVAA